MRASEPNREPADAKEAKREQALQSTLDAIEKRLRRRMQGFESGNVAVTIKDHDGLINHVEFSVTEHVSIRN